MKIYDVIIIGAGPAGLAAGVYAGRSRLDTLIIEKQKYGGQIVISAEIENYPGSVENETGRSLIDRMVAQTDKFGVETVFDTIIDVEIENNIKILKGLHNEYRAKSVIIAAGATPVLIGCPGEKEFSGKGVSYCATCDGAFFDDMEVYVVGGGDSAIEEAIYLTRFARKVTVIHRRNELRAVKSLQEKAFHNNKIEFMWNSTVVEIKGDGLVESMIIKNTQSGELKEIFADKEDGTFGIFVFIGFKPHSEIFNNKVEMESGYIMTDNNMKTSVEGVFAAGDIRVKSLRQVVTATADGALAAVQAGKYLEDHIK